MGKVTHRLLRKRAKEIGTSTDTRLTVIKAHRRDGPASYSVNIKHGDKTWAHSPHFTTRECMSYMEAFEDGWTLRDMQAEQPPAPSGPGA